LDSQKLDSIEFDKYIVNIGQSKVSRFGKVIKKVKFFFRVRLFIRFFEWEVNFNRVDIKWIDNNEFLLILYIFDFPFRSVSSKVKFDVLFLASGQAFVIRIVGVLGVCRAIENCFLRVFEKLYNLFNKFIIKFKNKWWNSEKNAFQYLLLFYLRILFYNKIKKWDIVLFIHLMAWLLL
jgi:hypothetical protein